MPSDTPFGHPSDLPSDLPSDRPSGLPADLPPDVAPATPPVPPAQAPPPPDGPPPPPSQRSTTSTSQAASERPVPRVRATVWVAGLGAGLLLAAAATFLVASWDTLSPAARVAVVGAVTGAAIIGGQRLRRPLPAVGAVVFHLGAVLLPVDALGLALQFDASEPTRWIAVGATALALTPLAVVGRSRMLGLAALAGMPLVATGLGAAGIVAPAVIVAVAAVLVHLLPDRLPWALRPAARLAVPGLAGVAVVVPVVLTVLTELPGSGGPGVSAAAAGWTGDWLHGVLVGSLSVGAVVAATLRRRDERLAAVTLGVAVLAVVQVVLPAGTPRTVQLVTPALVALTVQLVALLASRDRLWRGPTRAAARVVEVVGVVWTLVAVGSLLEAAWSRPDPDGALAAAWLVVAAAWVAAAARRLLVAPQPHRVTTAAPEPVAAGLLAIGAAALAALHLAAGLAVAGGQVLLTGYGLLVAATLTLAVLVEPRAPAARPDGVRVAWERLATGPARAAALASAGGLTLLAGVVGSGRTVALLAAVALPLVVSPHLDVLLADRTPAQIAAAVTAVVVAVPTSAALAVDGAGAAGLPDGTAALVVAVGLLALAAGSDRVPALADAVRLVAAVIGLVVTFAGWPAVGLGRVDGPAAALLAADRLALMPAALVPALVVGGWLTVDAVRHRRGWIAAGAGPLWVRAVAAALLAVGVGATTVGLVLLFVGLSAGLVVAASPRRLAALPTAVLVVPVGIALLGGSPVLHAVVVVAVGLVVVAAGAVRRRPLVAHLGGLTAIVGVWRLLTVVEVDAVDLWLLPAAVHLAAAGWAVRRHEPMSSWVAYAPAVLLVGVGAVVERAAGGGGWHAVLAGSVAVLAVLAGGATRLGGPLAAGTVLLVAVVLVETVAVVAVVPTWVWLAVGGLTLLGAAAAIERCDGSPAAVARRLARVASDRPSEDRRAG